MICKGTGAWISFYRGSDLQGYPVCILSIYRSRSLSFLTGKDGAASCGKGVYGTPFPGYPAGDYRQDEGCFPGIEGERETASWERDF